MKKRLLSMSVFLGLLCGWMVPSVRAAAIHPSCTHPYFPLRAGYEISYRHPDQLYLPGVQGIKQGVYGADVTNDTEVVRVTRMEKGFVRLVSNANWIEATNTATSGTVITPKKERVDQTIYCKKEGLQGLGDINMTPEKMASLAVGRDLDEFIAECGRVKAVGYSGIYLPKTLTSKSEWKNSFHITLSATSSTTGCDFNLTTSSTYKAFGSHPVKVGKKTYTGIAVAVITDLIGTSSRYGVIDTSFGPRVMYWVKGMGFVKMTDAYGNLKMETIRVKLK